MEGDFAVHSDSMRICVYRTTQEALANVERHSEATKVPGVGSVCQGGVDLIVRDNGKGFAPKSTKMVTATVTSDCRAWKSEPVIWAVA